MRGIKNYLLFVFFVTLSIAIRSILPASLFAQDTRYEANFEVTVHQREAVFKTEYRSSEERIRIVLPERARLISVSQSVRSEPNYNVSGQTIEIRHFQTDYQGRVTVRYSIAINDITFQLNDWIPYLDMKGLAHVAIKAPATYEGIVFPYQEKTPKGYLIDPAEKPYLLCGRFRSKTSVSDNITHNIYYEFRIDTSIETIAKMYKNYRLILSDPKQKEIILVTLPTATNQVRFTDNTIFIALNNTQPFEIKRGLTAIWFGNIIKMDRDYAFAFRDLYSRIIDNEGNAQREHAFVVPVPDINYYQNSLRDGFGSGDELFCNSEAMIRNFAMLHFAYYTVGLDNFIAYMKKFVNSNVPVENLGEFFPDVPSVKFVINSLLPIARFMPDLYIQENYAYRNNVSIPDVEIRIGEEIRTIEWKDARRVAIEEPKGRIVIDPQNLIPQLDFYNDSVYVDTSLERNRQLAYDAATRHRRYSNESFREIYNLEKIQLPPNNLLRLPADANVYVAIVKIYAPIRGRFTVGIKEMIIHIDNGRPNVVYNRVRI